MATLPFDPGIHGAFRIEGNDRIYSRAQSGLIAYPDDDIMSRLKAASNFSGDINKLPIFTREQVGQLAYSLQGAGEGRYSNFRNETGIQPISNASSVPVGGASGRDVSIKDSGRAGYDAQGNKITPNVSQGTSTTPLPLLKQGTGSREAPNETVRAIQKQLNITQDGIFGPQTKSAVMNFQQQNGLQVDGIVGPLTTAALAKVANGAPSIIQPETKKTILPATIKAPDDPSNEYNTATGASNPKYINPATGKTQQQEIEGINANANSDMEKLLEGFKTNLGTKVDVSDSSKLIKTLTDSFIDNANAPAKTSLVDTLNTKRAELGVGAKETELTNINSEIAKLDAEFSELSDEESNRKVSVLQIGRRKTEQQNLYNKARNDLTLKRNSVVNELNQKYSVIDSIMKYTSADYENAQENYTTKFNQAISITNLIKNVEEAAKSDAEKKVDNARANVQIMMTTFKGKKVDFSKLDSATLLDLKNMEIQAGLPNGFIKFAMSAVDEPVISIGGEYTDASGSRRTPIYTKNPSTGLVTVKTITLPGGTKPGGTKDNITIADTTKIFSDFLKTGVAPSGQRFGNAIGSDGYVDPGVYIKAFQEWTGTTTEFLSKFPVKKYINPLSYKLLPASIAATVKDEDVF